jgi:hypothetical protein
LTLLQKFGNVKLEKTDISVRILTDTLMLELELYLEILTYP